MKQSITHPKANVALIVNNIEAKLMGLRDQGREISIKIEVLEDMKNQLEGTQ